MYGTSNKGDLRVRKTNKALYDSIFTLLSQRNFNEITVNDLCSEALISRATFYTHFNDKYDLLKYMLTEIKNDIVKDVYKYDQLEREVNQFINLNKRLITNILKGANDEVLVLIREFMSSIVYLTLKRNVINVKSPNYIILSNFFIGGLVNLLTWIVDNNFPSEINMINTYLYDILEVMTTWDANQEQKGEPWELTNVNNSKSKK